MNLLYLATDIQEEFQFLSETADGRDEVNDRS
jgi:hypothetical protein